jgi:hypothetical protein
MASGDNPYLHLPDRSFWSRAVSAQWSPRDLPQSAEPLLRANDRIISAGSCFAANMVPFLEAKGFSYIRTERMLDDSQDRFGYGRYSAAYGNIYTARQFSQLIQRVNGKFKPVEDRWIGDRSIVDPFRPGLPYPAESEAEYDLLTLGHLERVGEAIVAADVLFFTLGLTEAWASSEDGAVFPACPGTVAGTFEPSRHIFKNFTVSEVVDDLGEAVAELRAINRNIRVVLTVSPVPLVATATGRHVLVASTFSKSVLRVACEQVVDSLADVTYFPAFELATGPQAPDYFSSDRRNVTEEGVRAVAEALFQSCQLPEIAPSERDRVLASKPDASSDLSRALVRFECEEMMADARMVEAGRGR